jgi:hypothetical protein
MAGKQTASSDQDFGTFEKDGATRVARDQAQAVDLRFRGWEEKKPGKAAEALVTQAPSTTAS